MSKHNVGDKFILEITGIDEEMVTQGYPKPAYLVKGMSGAFSENALDKLERIPVAAVKTNGDKIRSMTDDELAAVIMCPYDTAGDPIDIMPCATDGTQKLVTEQECRACCIAWLQREVNNGKET